ncbi:MAG: hypothetical protein KGJ23_06875 [Euryarchaeota archaeon]|nr:hypothetical protein [Euryarchaeota archaeon]MDE1836323.1 hypothetical protein [Euryarchaeota archaeon]MDE1879121.1 hypothetical protein [Euryarchaeota archaeon]MDE2044281.1 hypothetical protein [Thermoplasmata archaeon]
MSEHHRLPVGFFTSDGQAFRSVELDGEQLASDPVDPGPELSPPPTGASLTVHRTLYRTEGASPLVVHSVIEQRRGHAPLLARLQTYGSWAELMLKHPDLARSAGYASPSLLAPRKVAPQKTLENPEDALKVDASPSFP